MFKNEGQSEDIVVESEIMGSIFENTIMVYKPDQKLKKYFMANFVKFPTARGLFLKICIIGEIKG